MSPEDPIFILRGYIARVEELDAQVLNARISMAAAECARLTDKAHYLIGKIKWWIANATPDRAYAEASVWFPAIDDLEKQVAFALTPRQSYRDMLADHAAERALAAKVHDTVIDGLIANAEQALRDWRQEKAA